MKEIQRLLTLGELILPTDERLTLKLDWEPVSKSNTFRPGDRITLAHHPHRRREKLEDTAGNSDRIQLICAALSGLCSNTDPIADAMKKEPGGSTVKITSVLALTAIQTADATMQLMKPSK